MMRKACAAAMLGLALFAGPGIAQETTPDPGPASDAAAAPVYTPDPERLPYRHTLRLREGETRIKVGRIATREAMVSIPVGHRRTGVLLEDLHNSALFAGNALVAAAGTPGYQAGAAGSDATLGNRDIWCFLPRASEGNYRVTCLADMGANRNSQAVATITSPPANPFAAPFYSVDGYVGTIPAPRVEDRPIEFTPDLRIEYTLHSWSRTSAYVNITLNGDTVETLRSRRQDDGTAVFNTPVGRLRLRQVGERNIAMASLEPFAPVDERTLAAAREYLALRSDFRRLLSSPPQPLLRGVSEVTPDAAPRAVEPGAIVFTQMVQPGPAMRQDQTPRARENAWGPPGAPLLPVRRFSSDFLCWRQGTIEGGWWSGVRSHCLQNADGQPGYELHWQSAPFLAGSSFAMTGLTGRASLREPVTVSAAPDHTWPSEHLVVRYQGLEGELRDDNGALRPRAVRFVIQIGRAEPQIENWQAVVRPLDGEGGAVLTLAGHEVARISGVQLNGAAQLQTLAGLPSEAAPPIDGSAALTDVRERLRALRAVLASIDAEESVDPNEAEED